MTQPTSTPFLPIELILLTIEHLIPPNDHVALPSSHPTTRTLLTLCLTSRSVHLLATRLLYTHCLYISTSNILRQLLHSSPLSYATHESHKHKHEGRGRGTLPPLPDIKWMSSMYLAPFEGEGIDDQPTAIWIYELFSLLRDTLRHLVIDIELRSLHPWQDHLNVRPTLRSAFCELRGLETFVSVRDELYLDTRDRSEAGVRQQPVWSRWHGLRRLALYNVDVTDEEFKGGLMCLPQLERLVLTRTDGLDVLSLADELSLASEKEVRVALVDGQSMHHRVRYTPSDATTGATSIQTWMDEEEEADEGRPKEKEIQGAMSLVQVDVPMMLEHRSLVIEICQDWVKDRALGCGSEESDWMSAPGLWDAQGIVKRTRRIDAATRDIKT